MKDILIQICEEYSYVTKPNKHNISAEMLISAAMSGNIISYIQGLTSCSKQSITLALKNTFPDRNPIKDKSLIKFLLAKRNLKHCSSCTIVKDRSEFYTNSAKNDGLSDLCKTCSKEARKASYAKDPSKEIVQNKLREENLRQRTPGWADLEKITEFYRNRPEGHHVDHIVPLNGALVSGLNVLENLQYLPAEENLKKKNKYVP